MNKNDVTAPKKRQKYSSGAVVFGNLYGAFVVFKCVTSHFGSTSVYVETIYF